jgi:hypothetical protein
MVNLHESNDRNNVKDVVSLLRILCTACRVCNIIATVYEGKVKAMRTILRAHALSDLRSIKLYEL